MKDFKYPISRSYRTCLPTGDITFSVSCLTDNEPYLLLKVVFNSEHRIIFFENKIEDVFTLSQELQRIAVKLDTMF